MKRDECSGEVIMQRRILQGMGALGIVLVALGSSHAILRLLPARAADQTDTGTGKQTTGRDTAPSQAAEPAKGNRFGAIRGRLVWDHAELPKPQVLQAEGRAERDPEVCARGLAIVDDSLVIDPRTKGIKNGIAYLANPKGTNPKAEQTLLKQASEVIVDQENCEFVPRVTALHEGQRLVFTSSDRAFHNIHLIPFTNGGFNQVMAPLGQLSVRLVAEKQPILVRCDMHFWMQGVIRVFDHPFFARTNADGSFEIRGVPAGMQRLVVWHERAGYVTAGEARGTVVQVKADEVTDVGDLKFENE